MPIRNFLPMNEQGQFTNSLARPQWQFSCAPDAGATHAYWDLETTKTTFKNNIVLRARLEHSGS